MKNKQIGDKGEEIAAEFLSGLGFDILERNWRFGHKEIDLIARKDQLILFVEVKMRQDNRYGHPEEFVDARKQARLITAATAWLAETGHDQEIRFDIIAIHSNPGMDANVLHIPDAFFPFHT